MSTVAGGKQDGQPVILQPRPDLDTVLSTVSEAFAPIRHQHPGPQTTHGLGNAVKPASPRYSFGGQNVERKMPVQQVRSAAAARSRRFIHSSVDRPRQPRLTHTTRPTKSERERRRRTCPDPLAHEWDPVIGSTSSVCCTQVPTSPFDRILQVQPRTQPRKSSAQSKRRTPSLGQSAEPRCL